MRTWVCRAACLLALHNAEAMPFGRHPEGKFVVRRGGLFWSPQLIRYMIILLFGKARANAEPSHPTHEFGDFPNLLVPDFAVKLSKWSAVSR